jgi:prepilin-type N-terminal cleavage/methylation domain-containing protein
MKSTAKKGFTLIELLIVVVIIGILAAIAIPKFANTKDKAKLASVQTDTRNMMSVMEAVSTQNANKYKVPVLNTDYNLSSGNSAVVDADDAGYLVTVTNSSITQGTNSCKVGVGDKAPSAALDGVITCP